MNKDSYDKEELQRLFFLYSLDRMWQKPCIETRQIALELYYYLQKFLDRFDNKVSVGELKEWVEMLSKFDEEESVEELEELSRTLDMCDVRAKLGDVEEWVMVFNEFDKEVEKANREK